MRTSAIPRKSSPRKPGKIGALDAYVVSYPDLTSKLKYQNLLNYFIECINQVTSCCKDGAQTSREQLSTCVKFLESEYEKNTSQLNEQITATFKELLSDAHKLINLMEAFKDSQTAHPVDILLSAKSSHLQWLAVCLLEDLKIPLSYQ